MFGFFFISFVHSFFLSECTGGASLYFCELSQIPVKPCQVCPEHAKRIFRNFCVQTPPGAPVAHLGFGVGSKNTLSYTMGGCFKEAAIIVANHIFAILNGEILPWWCAVGLGILRRVLTGSAPRNMCLYANQICLGVKSLF